MASVAQGSCGAVGQLVCSASSQGGWVIANSDLQTADSATNLLKPALVSRTGPVWLEVPRSATRVLVRGRNLATMSATGTPTAVLRIIGMTGTPNPASTTTPWAAGPAAAVAGAYIGVPMRLDAADANAAGISLTFATTTNLEDDTYEWTDPVDLTGIDLKGCQYVTALVETACAVTGSAAVEAMFKFIN